MTKGNVSMGGLNARVMSNSTLESVEYMRRRRTTWAVGAALLIALGTTGAVFGASAIARNNAQKSHQVFATSSAEIASTLKLAIQHEQDMIVSAGGFVVGNPEETEAQFVRWADSVRALERYPELNGFGESVIVPAS